MAVEGNKSDNRTEKYAKPVKVLFVQKGTGLSGAPRSLLAMIDIVRDCGVYPTVVVGGEGWLTQELERLRVRYQSVDFGHWNLSAFPTNLKRALRLAKLAKELNADLVHANEHWVGPVAFLAARLVGLPVVCHFRCGLNELRSYRPIKYLFPLYDAVISIADVLTRRLSAFVNSRKLFTIRNPISIQATLPPRFNKKSNVVVCVGTIGRLKGQLKVLQACLPWLKNGQDRFLLFAGSIDNEPEYVDQIRRLVYREGLQRRVLFLGTRTDVPRLLRISDALVAYSEIEGIPRVVMEAMAMGRPPIVSNTPGMDELIYDGKTGFLVDFENQPHRVAQLLEALTLDPDMWHQISRNAFELISSTANQKAFAGQILTVYHFLLKTKRHKDALVLQQTNS